MDFQKIILIVYTKKLKSFLLEQNEEYLDYIEIEEEAIIEKIFT